MPASRSARQRKASAEAGALAVVLELLLVAAGMDLVVTGALGYCPLYARLNHVPKPSGTWLIRHSPLLRSSRNVTEAVDRGGSSW